MENTTVEKIKIAFSQEITLLVTGANFTMPDSITVEYIAKFEGKVLAKVSEAGRVKNGPFQD